MKLFKVVRRKVTALFRYIFRFMGFNRKTRRRYAVASGERRLVRWSAMGWWVRFKRGYRFVEPGVKA